ncbi:hypothetical protein MMG03_001147 [Fibrobacter succinogenes]|nr:hypothetical protein [Fibrobacter sp. UWH3]MCL4101569.1 hypothetical protein [Fibrobacter succinogenes]SHK52680.1 hypothetical protein SAMN05720765_10343 [Fibrobacter sp. UWH6]
MSCELKLGAFGAIIKFKARCRKLTAEQGAFGAIIYLKGAVGSDLIPHT